MSADTQQILTQIGDVKGKVGNIEGKLDQLIKAQTENNQAMWQAINKNKEDISQVKVDTAKRAGTVSAYVSVGVALIAAGIREFISG
jgi:ribosomal protein S5